MNKYIWGFILLTMLLSVPSLAARVAMEQGNDTYEIVVPFEDVMAFEEAGIDKEELLNSLTAAGVNSLSFSPITLGELEENHLIKIYESGEMQEVLEGNALISKEKGLFIQLSSLHDQMVRAISDSLTVQDDIESFFSQGKEYLFVPFGREAVEDSPISFDVENMKLAVDYGFSIVPRLENNVPIEKENLPLLDQLTGFSDHINHLAFIGDEVTGFSNVERKNHVDDLAEWMNAHEWNVAVIEQTNQDGMEQLISGVHNRAVRLHSMSLGHENLETVDLVLVNRAARAVKERNIGVLYVNIFEDDGRSVSPHVGREAFTTVTDFFYAIHDRTEGNNGIAKPFSELEQPVWLKMFLLIAGTGFVWLSLEKVTKRIAWLGAGMLMLIGIAGLAYPGVMFTELFALVVAVVAPIFGVLAVGKPETFGDGVSSFFKAIGIALTGCWLIVSLLYGWEYFMHIDGFRGVKLLAFFPLIVVSFLVAGASWLNGYIRFWQMLVGVVVVGMLFFYIGRTGNGGIVIPFELEIRQGLESLFGVRPRTTEFLIGYPMFIFGIYIVTKGQEWGRYSYIFGAMALSSLVSTFTHLHTPILVSVERSVWGIVVGTLFAMGLIFTWIAVEKLYVKWLKGESGNEASPFRILRL